MLGDSANAQMLEKTDKHDSCVLRIYRYFNRIILETKQKKCNENVSFPIAHIVMHEFFEEKKNVHLHSSE